MKQSSSRFKYLIWSYLAQFVNLGSAILVLPFMLKYLTPFDLGFWYILMAVNTFTTMMDFGFLPTISRNVTFALSGAEGILAEGIPTPRANESVKVNTALLKLILHNARRIYRWLSAACFLLLAVIGNIYVLHFLPEAQFYHYVIWLLFACACCLSLYFSYFNCILVGYKKVDWSAKVIVISRLTFVALVIAFIKLDFGLYSLVIGQFGLVIALCLTAFRKVKKLEIPKISPTDVEDENKNLKLMFYSAKKTGLVSIGGFLINRINIFFAPSILGLSLTASYGLSVQLFGVLSGLSMVAFNSSSPNLSESWIVGNYQKLRSDISFACLISWCGFILGAVIILFSGQQLISLIKSNTSLLSFPQILMLSITAFLEMNHSNFATVIMTKNEVPFVKPALISGAVIVCLVWYFGVHSHLGVWALLLPPFVVQLCYNNWIWPYKVAKELKLSLSSIVRDGTKVLTQRLR